MSSSSSKTSQARLREALTAGGPSTKDKGPPVADGVLSVTPDTAEAIEWRSRKSVVDGIASTSAFLDDDDEGGLAAAAAAAPAWPPCRFSSLQVFDGRRAHARACVAPIADVGAGPQTCELYGKFTWEVDKFGETGGKRELRSNVFEVGTFKWCAPFIPFAVL